MSRTRHTDKQKAPPAFLEFQLESTHQRPAPVGPLVELELGGGIILRIHPARLAQP